MRVPGSYIANAEIDWSGELWACYDLPVRVGGATVQPITFGVWSLLELAECDMVHPHLECTDLGAAICLYICANGQLVSAEVARWADAGRPEDHQFTENAIAFTLAADPGGDGWAALSRVINVSMSGFGMIPTSGKSNGLPNIYGLDTFASVVAAVGPVMGVNWHELMWQTPLAVIGHVSAQVAARNGAEGIARPKDVADIKRQLRLRDEREAEGKLHPWQEDDPVRYGLYGGETEEEKARFDDLYYAAAVKAHEARKKECDSGPEN